MTDKELLELAAKAAGAIMIGSYHAPTNAADDKLHSNGYLSVNFSRILRGAIPWNPLTNDDEAFRLAVKLGIDLQFCGEPLSIVDAYPDGSIGGHAITESGTDLYAATRRSIVRAAAEIGKGMK